MDQLERQRAELARIERAGEEAAQEEMDAQKAQELVKALQRKYYQKNKERIKARQREYERKKYWKNPEKAREKCRKFSQTERGKQAHRERQRRYMERVRSQRVSQPS